MCVFLSPYIINLPFEHSPFTPASKVSSNTNISTQRGGHRQVESARGNTLVAFQHKNMFHNDGSKIMAGRQQSLQRLASRGRMERMPTRDTLGVQSVWSVFLKYNCLLKDVLKKKLELLPELVVLSTVYNLFGGHITLYILGRWGLSSQTGNSVLNQPDSHRLLPGLL